MVDRAGIDQTVGDESEISMAQCAGTTRRGKRCKQTVAKPGMWCGKCKGPEGGVSQPNDGPEHGARAAAAAAAAQEAGYTSFENVSDPAADIEDMFPEPEPEPTTDGEQAADAPVASDPVWRRGCLAVSRRSVWITAVSVLASIMLGFAFGFLWFLILLILGIVFFCVSMFVGGRGAGSDPEP